MRHQSNVKFLMVVNVTCFRRSCMHESTEEEVTDIPSEALREMGAVFPRHVIVEFNIISVLVERNTFAVNGGWEVRRVVLLSPLLISLTRKASLTHLSPRRSSIIAVHLQRLLMPRSSSCARRAAAEPRTVGRAPCWP